MRRDVLPDAIVDAVAEAPPETSLGDVVIAALDGAATSFPAERRAVAGHRQTLATVTSLATGD